MVSVCGAFALLLRDLFAPGLLGLPPARRGTQCRTRMNVAAAAAVLHLRALLLLLLHLRAIWTRTKLHPRVLSSLILARCFCLPACLSRLGDSDSERGPRDALVSPQVGASVGRWLARPKVRPPAGRSWREARGRVGELRRAASFLVGALGTMGIDRD